MTINGFEPSRRVSSLLKGLFRRQGQFCFIKQKKKKTQRKNNNKKTTIVFFLANKTKLTWSPEESLEQGRNA